MIKEKYKQNLGSTKVAGVGVGRGERAGGDYGEVQDGGWGVGVSLLNNKSLHGFQKLNDRLVSVFNPLQ